jgi:hypothetical protein
MPLGSLVYLPLGSLLALDTTDSLFESRELEKDLILFLAWNVV